MYRITADGVTIYDSQTSLSGFKVVNPQLTMSDGSGGKLTFTIPPTNINKDVPLTLASTINVYKDGKEIWEGRILMEDGDFYRNRKVTCEGELGYLNDSIQLVQQFDLPDADTHEHDVDRVRQYLTELITVHNSRVGANRQFTVGDVTVADKEGLLVDAYTDYENTMSYVKNMADALEGHIRVEKRNGVRYIDFLAEEYDRQTTQTINFGRNLLDFTTNWDLSQLATVVIPLGEQLTNSLVEDATDYLTIDDVNQGSPYLESETAINTYGRIETTVHFNDITTPEELKTKGEEYLTDIQFSDMVLKCTALDLSFLGLELDDLRLRDHVHVVSTPHGMDRYFTISEVTLDLSDVSKNSYTLGLTDKQSISQRTIEANQSFVKKIVNQPSYSEILKRAKHDAAETILGATTGRISILQADPQEYVGSDAIVISQTPIEKAPLDWHDMDPSLSQFWMWNMGGLGFFKYDSVHQQWEPKTAITSDGKIVADFITAGTMTADRVRGGTFEVGGYNNQNGTFYVKDAGGRIIVSIDNTGIKLNDNAALKFQSTTAYNYMTQVTKDTVTTQYVNALDVEAKTVKAGWLDAQTITGNQISGGTITGITVSGCSVYASQGNLKVNDGSGYQAVPYCPPYAAAGYDQAYIVQHFTAEHVNCDLVVHLINQSGGYAGYFVLKSDGWHDAGGNFHPRQ